MKKPVRPLTPDLIQREYPIEGNVSGWYFRCSEISAGAYLAEGSDLLGRQVGCQGHDPDRLIAQCESAAREIQSGIDRP